MIAALTCFLAFSALRQDGPIWTKVDLPMAPTSAEALYYQEDVNPLEPARLSPKKFGESKQQWEFPWIVTGWLHQNTEPAANSHLIFRVYSQEHKPAQSNMVTRMLLRLSAFNLERLHLVHSLVYHNGIVDVFLCFGGRAGGEQLFDEEILKGPGTSEKIYKANTIYIYDTPSFTDPVEMAREVAHEYGHATLSPIGGFLQPERWANGYLSEKLYLRWIRDAMAKNEITSDDAMGATKEGIDKWLATNADPLISKAAQTLPTPSLLADTSSAGMDAFLGLALYIDMIYSDAVFARTLKVADLSEAKEYLEAVLLAAEEPEQVTLKIPVSFIRKAIWIPLGKGKLTGAQILKRDPSGWAQIQIGANPIVITNKRD